ncbi:NUDIX domain-containing protein [soil metagenome]
MGWAQLRDGGTIFQVRVGGVAVSGGRVLMHRTADEEFWSLPGGRLQVGETVAEALRREMREEIGADVEVGGGLLWLVENFFEHRPLDGATEEGSAAHHEVGLYLEMILPEHLEVVDSFMGAELAGTPDEFALEFRWFPQSEVAALDVRPVALRERLRVGLPGGVPFVVQRS